ncbi:unnamed protein product [Rotaria socialis]|uniref:Uncharacterized protein n=1 Tax=Rotaria socialis TaxID=392032 RepID=A0A818ZTT1_9BILA|nr:unnamed protein product [Rotaria socialis]
MDKVIQPLSHDNDLLDTQWSDIFMRIEQAAIPDESKLVLKAFVDYLLAEPIDASLSDVKKNVNYFDSARIDEWYLNFLITGYEDFEIDERLCSIPIKINLIERILQS